MEKVINRLSLYDIIGVWLTGTIIMFFTALLAPEALVNFVDLTFDFENVVFIIVGGYFIGMIFQEIGSFIYRQLIDRNNKYLEKCFKGGRLLKNITLTEKEKKGINDHFKEEEDKRDIYNFCKIKAPSTATSNSIDQNQVLAAISRSLSLYFLFFGIHFVIRIIYLWTNGQNESCQICCLVILMFLSALLSVLLYYRTVRFTVLRYTKYFQVFYYSEICTKESNTNEKGKNE